jgi:hypothetical protein
VKLGVRKACPGGGGGDGVVVVVVVVLVAAQAMVYELGCE